MFYKNSFWLGTSLGIVIPLLVYTFFKFISQKVGSETLDDPTLQVIAITCNVFVFRFYMVRRKMMNTGKGILFVTFIYAFYYFYKYL